MNRTGTLYILAAPSGAGKTTLVRGLLASTDEIVISISHTTRPQRPDDQEGVDYHFVTEENFMDMVQKQVFLEHANVFGCHYGTSKDWVLEMIGKGVDVILEIDWQGARQIRQLFPGALSVYILPPSMSELQQRLLDRNQDEAAVIARRMQQSKDEMRHYHEFDFIVINDEFQQALAELRAIVIANRLRTSQQAQIQQNLLAELTQSG